MESLGTRLKQERERKKMTLDEVATSTKIGTRMLKAIEEDHFDQLPGGIFNKGFVRSYARHLGLNEEQAVADYLAATGPSQPIKEPEAVLSALAVRAEQSRSVERPGAGGLPWDKLAAVLLLIAFGFALWGWRSRKHRHAEPNSQPTPPAATSVPVPATASSSPAPQPPASNSPEPPPQPPTLPSAPNFTPPQPTASGTFTILIHAHDDSWLEVTADGKDIANGLLPAGGQRSVGAQGEIVIKAGNIGGLDFTFNGQKLPPQGAPDEVKTLRFGPAGLEPAPYKSRESN